MKHARIAWSGAVHDAVESDGQLLLTQGPHAGRCVPLNEVVWLPPLAPTAVAPCARPRCLRGTGQAGAS